MGKAHQRTAYEELAKGFETNAVFAHMHSYDLYRKWLEAIWAFLDAGGAPQNLNHLECYMDKACWDRVRMMFWEAMASQKHEKRRSQS